MRPLYRRGPAFSAAFSAPVEDAATWSSTRAPYGPPDDLLRAPLGISPVIDMRLFSLYFLVAETLATYVGYRITQHCLRGCRVRFLSPTSRMWIGITYCWLKINLIHYAFHGSAYFTVSLLVMILYFVYSFMALGFHLGPLQFLFYDYMPHSKSTKSLFEKTVASAKELATRTEIYVLQQFVCVPQSPHEYIAERNPLALVASKDTTTPSCSGFSKLSVLFGRDVSVRIDLWNRQFLEHWMSRLLMASRRQAVAVHELLETYECRFVFVMQYDGLLLALFPTSPTATIMVHLRSATTTPFELVLRYRVGSHLSLLQVKPQFYYAESPRLVGRPTAEQKAAIYQLLCDLNASSDQHVDVSLRSLRCKNFVAAGSGQVVKKKARTRSFSSDLQDSFG